MRRCVHKWSPRGFQTERGRGGTVACSRCAGAVGSAVITNHDNTKGCGATNKKTRERGMGEAYPHDLWDKGLESGERGPKEVRMEELCSELCVRRTCCVLIEVVFGEFGLPYCSRLAPGFDFRIAPDFARSL